MSLSIQALNTVNQFAASCASTKDVDLITQGAAAVACPRLLHILTSYPVATTHFEAPCVIESIVTVGVVLPACDENEAILVVGKCGAS